MLIKPCPRALVGCPLVGWHRTKRCAYSTGNLGSGPKGTGGRTSLGQLADCFPRRWWNWWQHPAYVVYIIIVH